MEEFELKNTELRWCIREDRKKMFNAIDFYLQERLNVDLVEFLNLIYADLLYREYKLKLNVDDWLDQKGVMLEYPGDYGTEFSMIDKIAKEHEEDFWLNTHDDYITEKDIFYKLYYWEFADYISAPENWEHYFKEAL